MESSVSRSCRRASELMSLQMEQPLALRQRMSLRTHLLICSGCRRAQRQMRFLRIVARQLGGHE
ncbi:MAG TPA: zf-HC2 domain-containing protein [Rhodocyclaceae bacterium]|nr:zf-HC2 domain-containing protein [Rhodocyclaceae bacterium]